MKLIVLRLLKNAKINCDFKFAFWVDRASGWCHVFGRRLLQLVLPVNLPAIPLAVLFAMFGYSGAAVAQDIEEVVVNAERNDNALIDEGTSATVIDGGKLADAGIDDVGDVAAYVPNLALTETASGTNIVIRGIGSGVNQGFDQSVGLYIDQVPLPRSQMARAPFLDLAGVQVLRGPQYVKDGNYSLAGSIHLITQKATDEFEAALDWRRVPSQNSTSTLLTLGMPVTDSFGVRVALQSSKSDGYIENVFKGSDNPGSKETLARVVAAFDDDNSLEIKFKAEFGEFDTNGRAAEIIQDEKVPDIGQFDYGSGVPGFFSYGVDAVAENNNWTLGATPVSISADPAQAGVPFRRLPRENIQYFQNNSPSTAASTALDRQYFPFRIRYDADAETALLNPGAPATPIYAGRSYTEILEDLYVGTGGPYASNYRPEFTSPTEFAAPAGLRDTSVNFKRAADADERSNNQSLNLTLNVSRMIGEHKVSAVASNIDYDYEEVIDLDFTPVSLILADQREEFEQQFFRFEYESPSENSVRLSLGASYLESKVTFNERIEAAIERPANQAEAPGFIVSRQANFDRFYELDPTTPISSLVGRDTPDFTRALELLVPARRFEQDTSIFATFAELAVDFGEDVTATAGLRFTKSEKIAERELNFVFDDGSTIDIAAANSTPTTSPINLITNLSLAASALEVLLGTQAHSDQLQDQFEETGIPLTIVQNGTIRGARKEDAILPSLSVEWRASEWVTLRAAARTASKLGGFDARSSVRPDVAGFSVLPAGTFEFEDEEAITYELGGTFFMPSGILTATLYFTEFESLQVSTSDGRAGTNVRNAGAARTLGMELEGQLSLTESLGLNISAAWTDFEFTDFQLGSCPLGEEPDYLLLTGTLPNSQGNLTRGLLKRAFPEIVGEGTNESYAAALNAYNADILDGGRLERVNYGTDPFPFIDTTGLSAAEEEALIIDTLAQYEFGFVPVGRASTSSDPTGVVEFATTSPVAPFQWNNNSVTAAYFCDFKGRTNQYVAEWQGTFGLSYEQEIPQIGLFKSALDILYNSGYHTTVTLDDDVYQEEYVQFNGRVALADPDEIWEVAVIGENLTNEKIVTYATETPIGSRVFGAKGHFGFVRPPRSVGLNLRYKFY